MQNSTGSIRDGVDSYSKQLRIIHFFIVTAPETVSILNFIDHYWQEIGYFKQLPKNGDEQVCGEDILNTTHLLYTKQSTK